MRSLSGVMSVLLLAPACAPANLGEACDGMAQTFCDRQVSCTGDSSKKSDCLRSIYATCCNGIVCTEPVKDQAQVASCRAQLQSHSCTLIAQSVLPPICFGALAPPPLRVGGLCGTEEAAGCEEGNQRLLVCRSQAWQLALECRGSAHCVQGSEEVTCDSSGNTVRDRCPAESEGKERCDPATPSNILRCRSGLLEAVLACPTPTRCGLSGTTLTCI